MEELEPRLLFSADLPGVLAQSGLLGGDTQPTPPAITALVDTPSFGVVIGGEDESRAESGFTLSQPKAVVTTQKEIVFVDAGAPNYQQLINDLIKAQAAGRPIEVVVLETGRDGIEQITEAMAERRDVSAMHIVSHGSDGSLALGDAKLSAYNLEKYRDQIASWKDSLTEGADLLIYGCDFAGSAQGREMVESLGSLTGTDVAASTDKTGSSELGGDWDLEYEDGEIEAQIAFSTDLQQEWQGTLATYEVTNTLDDGSAGSLRWAVNQSNATTAIDDNITFNIVGGGPHSIVLGSALNITDTVNMDATTQSGSVVGTLNTGAQHTLNIELTQAVPSTVGINFQSGSEGSTLRGFVLSGFIDAINMSNSGNLTIDANYIGTDVDGLGAGTPNSARGIDDAGFGGNTITNNLISGNTDDGIRLVGSS